jgi:3-methyladenine DNA glycosylase/8-oxoguanine DNA glycosylase
VSAKSSALEVEVTPPSPFLMPRFGGEDRVMRIEGGVATRLLDVGGSPVLVRAWQVEARRVKFRAEPGGRDETSAPPAADEDLRVAIERMRFALGVDEDLGEFFRGFRRDPLLGPLLRRRPHRRPHRRPWPWEALAWAIVKQLIESRRAATIQRRIVGRWGPRMTRDSGALRDVPGPATIAGRAPAELEAMGLSAARSIALRAVARDIAAGRCDPGEPVADARLLRVPEIGPWTVQCLGLFGRGEPDSLPAGDLMFLKLVGKLAHLGRRATVEEVEEFFVPYAPYRGLAGSWLTGV